MLSDRDRIGVQDPRVPNNTNKLPINTIVLEILQHRSTGRYKPQMQRMGEKQQIHPPFFSHSYYKQKGLANVASP